MIFNPRYILWRYIALRFVRCFIGTLICFFVITGLLESMEVIRRFSNLNTAVSILKIMEYSALSTFSSIISFFPFTAFLAAIISFFVLNNKSEIIAIRSIGISIWQILQVFVAITLIGGGVYITVLDSLYAVSNNRIQNIKSSLSSKKDSDELTITNSGVWFKDISKDKHYVIYTKSFSKSENTFNNIRIYEFSNGFERSIFSDKAKIESGKWKIEHGKIVSNDGNQVEISNLEIPTELSFHSVSKMTANPKTISFWNMQKYINMLDKIGLSSSQYQIHWYSRLSTILQMISMVLLATVFCIHPFRYQLKAIKNIVTALLCAIPVHFTNSMLIAYSEGGKIHIGIAAFILPSMIIIVCLIYLFVTEKPKFAR